MKKLILLNLLLPLVLTATDLKPWYEVDLRPDFKANILFQSFQKVATSDGRTYYPSNDFFLTGSLGTSLDKYAIDAELCAAVTRRQHGRLDHLKLTGRYRLMNDIVDDPVSLVVGLSLIQAGRPALYDPASFHHGLFGAEAHVSVGREVSNGRFWQKRYFGVAALGFSRGWPWMRADFTYSQNFYEHQRMDLFVNSLVGFGHHKLKLNNFRGYGSIQHRSIDLGFRYAYLLQCLGATLSGEYAYRFYAKNFPKNTSRFMITFLYPFGTGI